MNLKKNTKKTKFLININKNQKNTIEGFTKK